MPNTFELIASSTVGSGGAASIDFTSIPSTYTDLCIKMLARADKSGATYTNTYISFNGNTSSFSSREVYGTGSGTGSGNSSTSPGGGQGAGYIDAASATATTFASVEIYIPNYAGSTNKSFSSDFVVENNATLALTGFIAGLWSNTAAINRVTLTPEGSNFVQHSTAYLYGVKNA
jgi:hypothetical protein